MKNVLDVTQILANVATVLALIGVVVAYGQLRAGAVAEKRTTAITAWTEYLKLALEHPGLARPIPWLTEGGIETDQFSQYRWFIATMLFACEQVLDAHDGDESWEDIVRAQLRYHHRFLNTAYFDPSVYSEAVASLASEVKAQPQVLASPGE